jgi:adenylate cyclase class IV
MFRCAKPSSLKSLAPALFQSCNKNTSSAALINVSTQKRNRYDVTIDLNFRVGSSEQLTQKLKEKGASLLAEKEFEDVYYDRVSGTDAYALGKKDTWLRKHNGEWKVKLPAKDEQTLRTHLGKAPESRIPHYQEHVGEKAIRRELNLQQDATKPNQKSLEDDLKSRGIIPFATIRTKQTKFQVSEQDKITLELNTTNFGYNLGKLAALVPNAKANNLEEAMAVLQRVVLELGLDTTTYAPDSVIEYIYQNHKTDYFKALVDAKIVRDPSSIGK